MAKGKMVLAALLAISFNANAQYDENVMLDLSVLDNLGEDSIISEEPLFPVLPKETKKPSIKKIRKKAKKAVAQAKMHKAEVAPIVSQEKNIETRSEAKETQVVSEPKEEIVVVDREPVVDESVKIVPVDVEPAPIATPQAEETPVADEAPTQISTPESAVDTSPKTSVEAPLVTSSEEKPKAGLLVEEQQPMNEKTSLFSLTFAPDSDELTVEQMAAIDNVVGKFKNEKNNKIAIYSYNLDDGVDSFRKKRISLNRALAVRTYLIKQEYKNFSIKVININNGSDKINTVEIEEI